MTTPQLPSSTASAFAPTPLLNAPPSDQHRNVGQIEGIISAVFGGAFLFRSLLPRSVPQALLMGLGGMLLYRGLKGHCAVYNQLGINTHQPGGHEGFHGTASGI